MDIVFLIGESGSGKTTAALRCAQKAWQGNWNIGGFVALGDFVENVRDSFTLLDLATGRKELLARRDLVSEMRQGPFGFTQQGLALGHSAIRSALELRANLVVIDEVGPLELNGGGWAEDLALVRDHAPAHVLLTVRPWLVEKIAETFFPNTPTIAIPVPQYQEVLDRWNLHVSLWQPF
jgi:nucleoside-triphosphatase THEP1